MHKEAWDSAEKHVVGRVAVTDVLPASHKLKVCVDREPEAGGRHWQVREDELAFCRPEWSLVCVDGEGEGDSRRAWRRCRCHCARFERVEDVLVQPVVPARLNRPCSGSLFGLNDCTLRRGRAGSAVNASQAEARKAAAWIGVSVMHARRGPASARV